eukprot:TRINITY_DN3070_c0_g1_i2.p1 TRINITY_DN3070_c0_g1~~TRINITY_DN3070_c0_g1_i2.p1  ORF type:complete len:1065 (+),score=348.09 TRINITY_DN3070_c0_g1_i2:44-3238(+)
MTDGSSEFIIQVIERLKDNLDDKEIVMDCCDDITQMISEEQILREEILESEFVTYFQTILNKFEEEIEVCIRILSCLSHVLRDFANTTEAIKPKFLNLEFYDQMGTIVSAFETNKEFLKIVLPCFCTIIPNSEAGDILSQSKLFDTLRTMIANNKNEAGFLKDISLVLFNLSCSKKAMKKFCNSEGMKEYLNEILVLGVEDVEDFQSVLGFICPLLNDSDLVEILCRVDIADTFSVLLNGWKDSKEQAKTLATAIFVGTNNELFKVNLLHSTFFEVMKFMMENKNIEEDLLKELLSSVYNFAMLKEKERLNDFVIEEKYHGFLKMFVNFISSLNIMSIGLKQLYLKTLRNLAKNNEIGKFFIKNSIIAEIKKNIEIFKNDEDTLLIIVKIFRTIIGDAEGNIDRENEKLLIEHDIFVLLKEFCEVFHSKPKVLNHLLDLLADVTTSVESKVTFVNIGFFKYCIKDLLPILQNNDNIHLIIQTLATIINSEPCHEPIINDGSIKEIIQILNQKIDDRDFVLTICSVLTSFLESEKCLVEMFKQDAVTPFRLAFDKYSDDVGLCQSLWVIIWKASEVPETLPIFSNEEFIKFNMTSLKKFIKQNSIGLTRVAMNVLSCLVSVEANHEIIAKYDAFGLASDAADTFEDNRDITESIVSLYRAFAPTERYHEKLIEEIEVFELFTELLEVWESDKGIVNGISLAFLDIFTEDRAARVRESGFIEVLSGVCKNQIDNPEILVLLFQIIWGLSIETGNRDEFRKHGVIATMMEVSHKYLSEKRILASAIKAMWNLSAGAENKIEFAKAGAIELLEKIFKLYDDDLMIIEYGCGNIRNLCFDDENNQKIVENTEIPSFLMNFLDQYYKDPHTVCQITGAIWNLSSRKKLRTFFLQKHILIKMVQIGKRHYTIGPVMEQIAGVIWIYADSTERRKILADNGAITLLVRSFKKNFKDFDALEEITGAMCALSMYDFNKPVFARAGVVKYITKGLQLCLTNETLRKKCLKSLFVIACNLAMLPMIKDQFIDYGATPFIVKILDEYSNEMVPQAVHYMTHMFVDSLDTNDIDFLY